MSFASAVVLRAAALATRTTTIKNFSTTKVTKAQGWAYRNWDEAPKRNLQGALAIHTLVWWWIFHGIFTEPEHLIGHEAFLDVTQLTDEQLGIPPIDE